MRTFKIRRYERNGLYPFYSLTVPAAVGRQLEEAGLLRFDFELTDDGLLYRPVDGNARGGIEVPAWLKAAQ